jgi:hypothetical protein
LGVVGEPSTRDLVDRLHELRSGLTDSAITATETAIIYQALAERLSSRTSVPGDLSERELRAAFAEGKGLIFSELRWHRPNELLTGNPVFGRHHAFVPSISKADRLWRALQVRRPSIDDCVHTIRSIAKLGKPLEETDEDRMVVLETLRLLAERLGEGTELTRSAKRAIATLPLYTSKGWIKSRPVYTSDDPALLEGLSRKLPVWIPGGDLSQFNQLLTPLGIDVVNTSATVVQPEAATADEDSTELLGRAVSLLRQDLILNDPAAASALTISWDELQEFEVRVDPKLRVRVELGSGRPSVEIEVAARADKVLRILFLRNVDFLRKVDGAGSAIARLFTTPSPRPLAHAWLVACIDAEEGRTAKRLELAEQWAAEERARLDNDIAERNAVLTTELKSKQKNRKGQKRVTAAESAKAATTTDIAPAQEIKSRTRVLVDPARLVVTSINGGRPAPSRSRLENREVEAPLSNGERTVLVPVNRDGATAQRSVTPPPTFSPIDRETVGMEVLRRIWESDTNEIIDIRNQHGVGADAIDNLDRFVELKAYLGDEPDSIKLEKTQIERALTTSGYFLAVVSNLEGVDARPKVRIIIDPVHQLTTSETSSIIFRGVRSAQHSVVCYLEREPDDTEP